MISKKYRQQRNYCVQCLRKTMMECFIDIDVTKVNDNKWKLERSMILKTTRFYLLCFEKKTFLS